VTVNRPTPSSSVPDDPALETLLRQTFREETARVTLPADALPRLNARLDAANPPRRWTGPLRLAGAVAVAALLLALFTPIGRLAAAGVRDAAQTVVTTVRQIASGDGNGDGTPPSGTAAPRATNASGSSVAPTTGAPTGGTPAVGTASPVIGTPVGTPDPAIPTPTPRATDQPAASGTPVGTAIATAAQPSGAAPPVGTRAGTATAPVATATASGTPATTTPATAIVVITTVTTTPTTATAVAIPTAAPTATVAPTVTPTAGAKGSATPINGTVSPAPLPPSLRSGTPSANPSVTVAPPTPEPTEVEPQGHDDQCKGQNTPPPCQQTAS